MQNIYKIRENEVLSGYILRLHESSPNCLLSYTNKDLFGCRKMVVDALIPNNMNEICGRLFEEDKTEEIIYNHTLFNYFTAFYDIESKNESLRLMQLPRTLVYGVKRDKNIELSRYYKYCPLCMAEEMNAVGGCCWNRIHQITPVCTKHKVWIQESKIPTRVNLFNYIEYKILEQEMNQKRVRKCEDEKVIKISYRIEQLIREKNKISEIILKKIYIQKLRELGLIIGRQGSVRCQEIRRQIIDFFSEQLLLYLKVDAQEMRWINELLGNYRMHMHPLYHILMQIFLNINVTENMQETNQIITVSQCYCLNPLSSHYKKHKIDNVKVHYSSIGKNYMCTCICSCGFKFTTKLETFNQSGGTKIGKVKSHGTEYMEHLLQLRFLGIKGIAKLTGLGVYTVRHQLRRYDTTGSIECNDARIGHKKIKDSSQGKRLNKKVRNNWTSDNWKRKDEAYSNRAIEVVKNELDNRCIKPRRITRARFAKEIGNLNAILYCLDKMPQTKKVIEKYSETKEQYQMRRISWGIERLKERGEEIKPWKIIRVVRNDNLSIEQINKMVVN